MTKRQMDLGEPTVITTTLSTISLYFKYAIESALTNAAQDFQASNDSSAELDHMIEFIQGNNKRYYDIRITVGDNIPVFYFSHCYYKTSNSPLKDGDSVTLSFSDTKNNSVSIGDNKMFKYKIYSKTNN